MPTNKSKFHIRGLTEGQEDIRYMIEAFDAALPELAAVGSGEQWGTVTFGERPDKDEKLAVFEQARRYQTKGEGDAINVFIAEVEIPASDAADQLLPTSVRIRTDDEGKRFLAVGSVMLSQGIYPGYMGMQFDQPAVKEALDGNSTSKSDFVYLEGLVTDFRTGTWRKGAGSALIQHCRQYCLEKGIKTIFLDGFAGNNRVLPKYYQSQGFTLVQDCVFKMPDKMRTISFLRMDVAE